MLEDRWSTSVNSVMDSFLPGYFATLTSDASRERYKNKLQFIDGIDPYEVVKDEWSDDLDLWPNISHVHACMYLILTPSPYSEKDMLNYKSLDSYQNFVNGWVRQVLVKEAGQDKRIIIGKVSYCTSPPPLLLKNNMVILMYILMDYSTFYVQVNHSQKLSDKPLTPWVISRADGRILAAHCDCTAGLGETCSHVASLLWVIAVGVEKRESLTVTQKTAYWVMPPAVRSVPYAPIKEIEFIGKKKKAASLAATDPSTCPSSSSKRRKIDVPTDDEQKQFLDSLASSSKAKPAVLSVLPGYCDRYIPSALSSDLPLILTDLYRPGNLTLGYYDLLKQADKTVLTVTDQQCQAVEMKTRDQSNSRLWFRMRAGRITASKFKNVCCTDPANPSLSLIMAVCHPDTVRFKTAATSYGCQHERDALKHYKETSPHNQVCVSPSGFFISAEHPYFGASPDGMVCCSCCGPGICEVKVKCSFSITVCTYNIVMAL